VHGCARVLCLCARVCVRACTPRHLGRVRRCNLHFTSSSSSRRRLHPIVVCPSIRSPCPYACKTVAAVLARPNYPSQGSPRTSVSRPPSPPCPLRALPRTRPPPPHCPVSLTKIPRGHLTTDTSPSGTTTVHDAYPRPLPPHVQPPRPAIIVVIVLVGITPRAQSPIADNIS